MREAFPALSRRAWLGVATAFLLVAALFFPLRLGLDMLGAGGATVSARQVRGPLWWGEIGGLAVGRLALGDVEAGLSAPALLGGQVRLAVARRPGLPNPLSGAWVGGLGGHGVADATGVIPAGGLFDPLPVGTVELSHLDARFANGRCVRAKGQVRLHLTGSFAGLALSQGLNGAAICDGPDLAIPLVSQTGMERLLLRIGADGRYRAELVVNAGDNANGAALAAAGLSVQGAAYRLEMEGRL